MDTLLDFLKKPDGAILFMLLVVPGFLALRTMESRIAGERVKAGEAAIDIIVFSALNDGLWAIWLFALGVRNFRDLPTASEVVILVLVVFPSPIALALIYEYLRKKASGPRGLVHPVPKPWDWLFGDYISTPKQIIFTLSDGRRFGGLWQDPCFSSSHPYEEQIFISEVYNVDQNTGQLIDRIPHHCGLLVDKSTIDLIEIFDEHRPFAVRVASDQVIDVEYRLADGAKPPNSNHIEGE